MSEPADAYPDDKQFKDMTRSSSSNGGDGSLVLQAYNIMRAEILTGTAYPGQKLKIDALQKAHGFSSSPLREALNRLAIEGFVVAEGNRGFKVAPTSEADFQDIVKARLMLEPLAICASIEEGTDEWAARVVADLYLLEREESRYVSSSALDNEAMYHRQKGVHLLLLSGGGSQRIVSMCAGLLDQTDRYIRMTERHRQVPLLQGPALKVLADAVLSRDKKRSQDCLTSHIDKIARAVAAAL